MARAIKLFGGTVFYGNVQVRALVLAATKKSASEQMKPFFYVKDFPFSITWNEEELAIADGYIDGVWVTDSFYSLKPKYTRLSGACLPAKPVVAKEDNLLKELFEVAKATLEWIDDVPQSTTLPVMPGIDRDWIEDVLERVKKELNKS